MPFEASISTIFCTYCLYFPPLSFILAAVSRKLNDIATGNFVELWTLVFFGREGGGGTWITSRMMLKRFRKLLIEANFACNNYALISLLLLLRLALVLSLLRLKVTTRL